MRQRRSRQFTSLAGTLVLCAAGLAGTAGATHVSAAAGAPAIRLHLPAVSAGRGTVHFGGVVTFAVPHGWMGKALRPGSNPTSEADFRVPVAGGCTALAFVTPLTQASPASARTQLMTGLPAAAQLGIPVPPPVRIVETGARARSGAWELVAPPAPPDGGDTFNYYGGLLVKVAPARWAGLTVGLTARPSACGPQVLHDRAAKAALTRLLRTATLRGATASG